MPCTQPLHAYRSHQQTNLSGKPSILFKKPLEQGHGYEEIDLPCGQCLSCRINRSRQWALRCIHEAQQWEHNCFITLTINDQNLSLKDKQCDKCPVYKRNDNQRCEEGSLCKRDFQLFMKKLRKKFRGYERVPNTKRYPIRYFHCGEYGSKLKRPHHHACVFNFQFPDRVLWRGAPSFRAPQENEGKSQIKLYRSKILEGLWPYGFSTIGEVTWQSAAYVARYVTKKITGDKAAIHYMVGDPDTNTGECYYIEPEYITMSRRPGIGELWFNKYGTQQYGKDFITHDGKPFAIPKYYDKLMAHIDEPKLSSIKKERRIRACALQPDGLKAQIQRLQAKDVILKQRFEKLMRSIENDPKNVQRI